MATESLLLPEVAAVGRVGVAEGGVGIRECSTGGWERSALIGPVSKMPESNVVNRARVLAGLSVCRGAKNTGDA